MEREQVINALECCQEPTIEHCAKCPYVDVPRINGRDCLSKCYEDIVALINSQEQRIKELTEENVQFRDEQRKLIEENEKLRASSVDYRNIPDIIAEAKAETVRKMQTEIKKTLSALCEGDVGEIHRMIDQITKEMLEGTK